MPQATAPLPLTVISGYLGAGKTTLVNHLLRHAAGRRLMVLVNDFGDLPIDADLIEREDGDMLTLANGCVCCSMGGDFYNALVDVLDMPERPDHLVIEASGVARPARIANIARAEPDLALDGVVTLVDAENVAAQLADDLVADSVTDQIAAADLLLVSKADLVSPHDLAALKDRLNAINPAPPVMTCISGAVPVDAVLGGIAPSQDAKPSPPHDHEHEEAYARWSHETSAPFDSDKLQQALTAFPDTVLRVKGIVFVTGRHGPLAIHRVGRRITIADAPSSTDRTSRLVAIGHRSGFDPALLTRLVDGALATPGPQRPDSTQDKPPS